MTRRTMRHRNTTARHPPEASIELNKAAYQARYHRAVRKPHIVAGTETRRYGPVGEQRPAHRVSAAQWGITVIDAWLVTDHSAPDGRRLIVARPHTARREANHTAAGHRVAVHIGLGAALRDVIARLEGASMAGERVEVRVERE